jgi:tRNA dimethylallyltransferase
MSLYNLITVLGPTASGKTLYGAHLAHALNGEIISADSRQVYKGMNLGTGKDYEDYMVKDKTIPVYLVDIHEAGYKYNLYEFQEDFKRIFEDIYTRQKIPIMVGGTGMYIEAILKKYELVKVPPNQDLRNHLAEKTEEELVEILKKYDPNLHNTTDLKIRKRTIRAIEIADHYSKSTTQLRDLPEIRSVIFGVKYDRNSRRKRITERLKARLNEGMLDEVRSLLEKIPSDDLIYYGLEYKFLTLHLIGELTYQEMFNKLEVAIHQFAKRQMTWFRKMERQGFDIHWLDGHMPLDEKIERSLRIIKEEAPELIIN